MSMEDEIRLQTEKKLAGLRDIEEQKRRQAQLNEALIKNGFNASTGFCRLNDTPPILQKPSVELQALIDEAKSSIVYINPKIVREMPDGTTRCRSAKFDERPDTYSLDVNLETLWHGDELYFGYLWIFDNGLIAFADSDGTRRREYVWNFNNSCTMHDVREKLVNQIATDIVRKEQIMQKEQSKPQKSGGCYIATSVYGSYDCPEVWVLRRYRDSVLCATPLGKLFVRIYYTVSPLLVKWFGKSKWFQKLWRYLLDIKISDLCAKGISYTAYSDEESIINYP